MMLITCARPSSGLIVGARGGIPNLVGRFGGAICASSTLNAVQVREFWVRVMYIWGRLVRFCLAVTLNVNDVQVWEIGLGVRVMCMRSVIYVLHVWGKRMWCYVLINCHVLAWTTILVTTRQFFMMI